MITCFVYINYLISTTVIFMLPSSCSARQTFKNPHPSSCQHLAESKLLEQPRHFLCSFLLPVSFHRRMSSQTSKITSVRVEFKSQQHVTIFTGSQQNCVISGFNFPHLVFFSLQGIDLEKNYVYSVLLILLNTKCRYTASNTFGFFFSIIDQIPLTKKRNNKLVSSVFLHYYHWEKKFSCQCISDTLFKCI